MIFDSVYDTYRGVVTYIRVIDGSITPRERILMMSTGATHEMLEVGVISPEPKPCDGPRRRRGRLPDHRREGRPAVPGRRHRHRRGASRRHRGARAATATRRPMVFSGLYPDRRRRLPGAARRAGQAAAQRRRAGLRAGDVRRARLRLPLRLPRPAAHGDHPERLEREFGLDLISTAPNVVYRVDARRRQPSTSSTNPRDWPDRAKIAEVYEPIVKATILAPTEYIGAIMELCQSRRGTLGGMDYLSETGSSCATRCRSAEIIFDFFDQLKSRTRGYASLDYEPAGEQEADLVKVDILLQGEPVDAFSAIVHKDKAYAYGSSMTAKLRELIPRQQFEVPIQAAIGARIIARENIRAIRKDVLAKCYGGDITRKRKLLEKQKEGKKRMKTIGRVEVPQEAFVAALSTTDSTKPANKKS